jgi:hypothetical protein
MVGCIFFSRFISKPLIVPGRQPTPPDFILGFQQSKLRYWNQSQIVALAERFAEEDVCYFSLFSYQSRVKLLTLIPRGLGAGGAHSCR